MSSWFFVAYSWWKCKMAPNIPRRMEGSFQQLTTKPSSAKYTKSLAPTPFICPTVTPSFPRIDHSESFQTFPSLARHYFFCSSFFFSLIVFHRMK